MAASRDDDSFVFQRVTLGLRKPIVRFLLPTGRRVELLSFHLEPGWAFGGDIPRPVALEVVRRLYPDEKPVFVDGSDQVIGSAYLCVAYLYSDTPAQQEGSALDYSILLLCGFVGNIDKGVRGMVLELLARIDWDTSATDDLMW